MKQNPDKTLIFFGDPVAQGRPRVTTIGGRPRLYDPDKSREYKAKIKAEAGRIMAANKWECLNGGACASFYVYCPIPKSWPKKKREEAARGEIRPQGKPDLSNYIKGIEDALNGVCWADDSLIVEYERAGKYYSDNPRVEVNIWEL